MPLTPGGSPDTIARAIAAGPAGRLAAAGGGGEPHRRQPEHRLRPGREERARRLHLAARAGQRVLGQSAPRQAAVRSRWPTSCRSRRWRASSSCWWCQPDLPANSVQELVALAQGEAGRAQLRLLRQRQPAAPRRDHAAAPHRHEDEPRALQGRGAGGRRPAARAASRSGSARRTRCCRTSRTASCACSRAARRRAFRTSATRRPSRETVPGYCARSRGSACSCRRRPRRKW